MESVQTSNFVFRGNDVLSVEAQVFLYFVGDKMLEQTQDDLLFYGEPSLERLRGGIDLSFKNDLPISESRFDASDNDDNSGLVLVFFTRRLQGDFFYDVPEQPTELKAVERTNGKFDSLFDQLVNLRAFHDGSSGVRGLLVVFDFRGEPRSLFFVVFLKLSVPLFPRKRLVLV